MSSMSATSPHVEADGRLRLAPEDASSPKPISLVSWLVHQSLTPTDPEKSPETESLPTTQRAEKRMERRGRPLQPADPYSLLKELT